MREPETFDNWSGFERGGAGSVNRCGLLLCQKRGLSESLHTFSA